MFYAIGTPLKKTDLIVNQWKDFSTICLNGMANVESLMGVHVQLETDTLRVQMRMKYTTDIVLKKYEFGISLYFNILLENDSSFTICFK